MSAQDLPLAVRGERVPLELTRESVELACAAVLEELGRVEGELRASQRGDAPLAAPARLALVAQRIHLIDALAELRGER